MGMGKESPERVERFVNEVADAILSVLPETQAYADRALALVEARRRRGGVIPLLRARTAGIAAAAAVGLCAGIITHEIWNVTQVGLVANVPPSLSNVRTRVVMLPDGRYQLFVVEDRATDPAGVVRLLRVDDLPASRFNEMFGVKSAKAASSS